MASDRTIAKSHPELTNEALVRQFSAWLAGIQYEIDFWEEWTATKGGQWPEDFNARLNPERAANPALFEGLDVETPKVLDVGAGPMSIFGLKLKDKPVALSACDPLAPLYADMASRHGVNWPVKTASAFAEDLSAFYPRGEFDLVYCRNALDHSFDPVRGIEEMLLVARPGGRVALDHYVNEAKKANYDGFHQWNFEKIDGKFIIWNKDERIDVAERFARCARVSVETNGTWIWVRLDKIAEPELAENRSRQRIAALLLASRDAFLVKSVRLPG
ncbi:MAG TPA: methyltransferase domain-containing protein [Xanthobacteraceae bacterium]|nr:methyltransferase domain-containing protein [Xanthobacteraceae bacterium]